MYNMISIYIIEHLEAKTQYFICAFVLVQCPLSGAINLYIQETKIQYFVTFFVIIG
jgi:hypothetical protein